MFPRTIQEQQVTVVFFLPFYEICRAILSIFLEFGLEAL